MFNRPQDARDVACNILGPGRGRKYIGCLIVCVGELQLKARAVNGLSRPHPSTGQTM